MSEKNFMTFGELEALIKKDMADDDETVRQQAQGKLLAEGSRRIADTLAGKILYDRNHPQRDLLFETMNKISLKNRLVGLEKIAKNSNENPYQEKAHALLIEAISIFKETGDKEGLSKIVKSFHAPREIVELASKALSTSEEDTELPPEVRPPLSVTSFKEITIEDDWINCDARIEHLSDRKNLVANFFTSAGLIQIVIINNQPQDKLKQELAHLEELGFEQSSTRRERETEHFHFKR